jgi:hypothetical protein
MNNSIRLSLFLFSLVIATVLLIRIDIEKNWSAFFYLAILFLLTVIPAILIFINKKSSWLVTLSLTPILLVSLDTFFLRLGVYNYFIYVENTWHPAINQDFLKKAAVLVLVGNFALWAGYGIHWFEHVGLRLRVAVESWVDGWFTFSEVNLWLVYFIGLTARFYILQNSLGGYFSFDAEAQTSAFGYVQYIGLVESLTALCLVVYFIFMLQQGKQTNWLPFYIMLGIELVTVFLMGFKGQVIFRPIYLALAYIYIKRSFPLKIIIYGAAFLMIIMPVNLLMRDQYAQGNSTITRGEASTILSGTINAIQEVWSGNTEFTVGSTPERFVRQSAQMQDFTLVVQYVDRTGKKLNGLELMNFFYSFIPRAVWQTKPIASLGGWFNAEVYGNTSSSAAAITVPGDFYLNFGWLGIPVGFLLLGGLLRVVQVIVLETKPGVRLASLVPFIILELGMPSSELGSHLAAVFRTIGFYIIVLTIILLPRLKTSNQSQRTS